MLPRGPMHDEGYSWVIFVASSFNLLIALGVPFSMGVYNVEYLLYFGESKGLTAWICSINIGLVLGCGPIVAWLMMKFSQRSVACCGAVLCTVGTMCMYFSQNVYHLIITYGVIAGFGYCMVYLPSAVIVGEYFVKYRSLTTGICSAAGGVGILCFPFLYNFIIERYTWRGSVFILAAVNLQMLVFSALLRPQVKQAVSEITISITNHEKSIAEDFSSELKNISNSANNGLIRDAKLVPKTSAKDISTEEVSDSKSSHFNSREVTECSKNNPSLEALENGKVDNHISSFAVEKNRHYLKEFESHVMFDFNFLVYFWSNIFWNFGTGILVILPADYLFSNGTDQETANMVVTSLGAGTIIGGALAGIVGNHPRCNRLLLYISVNVLAALSGILFLLSTDFTIISILNSFFGVFMGAVVALLVVLSADIVGIKKLSQAYGYLMFSNGIGNLAGLPMAGFLYDMTESYTSAIVVASVLICLGGLVMFLIPFHNWYIISKSGEDITSLKLTQPLSPLSVKGGATFHNSLNSLNSIRLR